MSNAAAARTWAVTGGIYSSLMVTGRCRPTWGWQQAMDDGAYSIDAPDFMPAGKTVWNREHACAQATGVERGRD